MGKSNITDALSKRIVAKNQRSDSIDKAYDAMFGLTYDNESEKIVELDLGLLKPHPSDPFKPYTEEKLKELADSIEKIGLIEPITVRQNAEVYEILSGKNRSNAVRLNGGNKIKSIIRDVDDDTAVMIITEANLKHREKLKPSEKGWAYRLQLETINKQGKRTDLAENSTSVDFQQKLSRGIVAEINDIKENEVQRYIRLTYLLQCLLENVDDDKIPIMAGVNLSYLNELSQTAVYDYLLDTDFKRKISVKLSISIRNEYEKENKSINADQIKGIVDGRKQTKISGTFSINRKKLKKFSGKLPDDKELERLFIEFLNKKFGI